MPGTKDERVGEIAGRQAGAVTSRQLRDYGMSEKDIKVRLRRGTLYATAARGVYRVGGAPRTWEQDLWIAVLAGPDGTLASHLSAAALRGLLAPPSIPHVTVPRLASGRFRGAVVHHGAIGAADRARYEGIACTALGRTIVDCAALLPGRALNELVDAAVGKRLCSYRDAIGAWERAGHVRGGSLLEAALAPYSMGAEPGSVGAARVHRRIIEWGLPMPLCEYEIRNRNGEWIATVDFVWLPWRFILEYDGGEHHGPRRRRLDARRQAAVEDIGFRVERSDRFDLRPSSTRLFDLLSAVLSEAPVDGSVRNLPERARPRRSRRSTAC